MVTTSWVIGQAILDNGVLVRPARQAEPAELLATAVVEERVAHNPLAKMSKRQL
jgi:hypothetical protein